MKNIAWLGLAAMAAIAACGGSRDPLIRTGGHGGGGSGGGATAGTGGARACERAECLRPYECVRSCGGPVEYTGCCACEAPLYDNFGGLACGGTSGSGAGGRGGTGGNAGTAGARGGAGGASAVGGAAAGTTGSAGARGGTTGTAGAAGARGGAGGSGGMAGARGGSGGGGGTGGARACETVQCIRPYECRRACGGPIESSGCCPCEAPLFDDFGGMACGDGGQGAVTYLGCSYGGGTDRIVVSKRDTARDLCFNVVLRGPGTAPADLTLPANYGLEWGTAGPAAACPARGAPLSVPRASSVTGSVTAVFMSGTAAPESATIDVTMTFGANDAGAPPSERLTANNVDVTPACSM
jgi:hypothetical protein